ncbi:MAG TPA: Ig-like domain-containing protein [Acidobacteriota bacterium]|nr:Ig-like domain-containing protein [Acidobacteriota bacterium]
MPGLALLLSVLAGSAPCWLSAQEAAAQLRFEDGSLEVAALADDFLEQVQASPGQCLDLLAVWTGSRVPPAESKVPQVSGGCRVRGQSLVFVPRYPWTPGVEYVALWRSADGPVSLPFSIPKPDLPRRTRVVAIHPGSDLLPMNLLRIYVQFSHSMSRGQAYQHIHLLDDEGRRVPHAFLDLRPELWDPQTRRFTLLFDPGRIKRGLEPHQQLGLPFYPGRSYRLVIDSGWEDGRGVRLLEGAEKAFRIGDADRTSPQPSHWKLELPAAGTRSQLRVRFTEPLDHALARRLIDVERGGEGDWEPVEGTVETEEDDQVWIFRPSGEWTAGDYRLSVGAWLEDLAGNNLNRPFDYDLESRQQVHEQQRFYRPFRLSH